MIDIEEPVVSVRRQCELLGLKRSSFYYQATPEPALNLHLMRLIDKQFLRTPFYGWPKMTAHLRRLGYAINGKRVRRLMRLMGIQAIYPRRSSSSPGKGHKRYPYLLRNVPITHVNQVWSADITYVPLRRGFMYLVAVIDWHSRYVLAWQLSNTLDGIFCLDALRQALSKGPAQDLQHRPGRTVHGRCFHDRPARSQHSGQHGRARPRARQRFLRTALAQRQV